MYYMSAFQRYIFIVMNAVALALSVGVRDFMSYHIFFIVSVDIWRVRVVL